MRTRLLPLVIALAPVAVQAQERHPGDRSISGSLFAVAVPSPFAPVRLTPDSLFGVGATRLDITYGRAWDGSAFAGDAHSMVILGVRREQQGRDSTRALSSGVAGIRVGLRADEEARSMPVAAVEAYVGGRTMGYLDNPNVPDAGIDVGIGFSDFAGNARGSLGVRTPVEFVRETARHRYTIFVAPTVAWGAIRLRECEDNGPGDNCGDLGIQLAFGRTRFLVAGGGSVTVAPSRLSLSGGVQRMLAAGELPRLWLGASWTP